MRNQFSAVCECCAANPNPAPHAIRIVTGTVACPPHVAVFRELVRDLIEAHPGEVGEHELSDGPQPRDRGPERSSHDRLLGDGSVPDPVGTEPLNKPTVVLKTPPAADVFA